MYPLQGMILFIFLSYSFFSQARTFDFILGMGLEPTPRFSEVPLELNSKNHGGAFNFNASLWVYPLSNENIGVGLGVNQAFTSGETNSIESDKKYYSLSYLSWKLLVSYGLIEQGHLVLSQSGLRFGVGLSNRSHFTLSSDKTYETNGKTDVSFSGSDLDLNIGFYNTTKLLRVLVADLEVGYRLLKVHSLKYKDEVLESSQGKKISVDFSGVYFMFGLGFGI